MELPERYAHWQEPLQESWREMLERYPRVAARWMEAPVLEATSYRLVVPQDALAARNTYAAAHLEGDPRVPRTFPALGLAVVPLPRDDALLAAMPQPPKTWLHSFRHECAHLLSLELPALREAPDWFQEGFAELWCVPGAGDGGSLEPLPQDWPYWGIVHRGWSAPDRSGLEGTPGEVLYAGYAEQAWHALERDPGPAPWEAAPPVVPGFVAGIPPPGLRGRHADWDPDSGTYRLFTRPGVQVDLDLEEAWDGQEPKILELQLGRSLGQVEAGVVLYGSTSRSNLMDPALAQPRIRLRYGLTGGLAAYPESGRSAVTEALEAPAGGNDLGRSRVVQLERDGEGLVIHSEGFRRSFDLAKLGLQWPLRLRMVVRDGAFVLQTR